MARTERAERLGELPLVDGRPLDLLKVFVERHQIGLAEHRDRAREREPVVVSARLGRAHELGTRLEACARNQEQSWSGLRARPL